MKTGDLKKQDPGHSSSVFTFLVLSRWVFFCDLTYFSSVCVLGLISSAGVRWSCLESVAAMATGDFSEATGKDRAAQVCLSRAVRGASRCSPFWTVAQSLGPWWDLISTI